MNQPPAFIPLPVEVRPSPIHRRGVFTKGPVARNTRIIEYLGEKITKAESDRRAQIQIERADQYNEGAVYIFDFDENFDFDGGVSWNMARYVNHSCDPNCRAVEDGGRIFVVANREITSGEELTYDYGYDLDGWNENPCRCGSPSCIGYVVSREFWEELRVCLGRPSGVPAG